MNLNVTPRTVVTESSVPKSIKFEGEKKPRPQISLRQIPVLETAVINDILYSYSREKKPLAEYSLKVLSNTEKKPQPQLPLEELSTPDGQDDQKSLIAKIIGKVKEFITGEKQGIYDFDAFCKITDGLYNRGPYVGFRSIIRPKEREKALRVENSMSLSWYGQLHKKYFTKDSQGKDLYTRKKEALGQINTLTSSGKLSDLEFKMENSDSFHKKLEDPKFQAEIKARYDVYKRKGVWKSRLELITAFKAAQLTTTKKAGLFGRKKKVTETNLFDLLVKHKVISKKDRILLEKFYDKDEAKKLGFDSRRRLNRIFTKKLNVIADGLLTTPTTREEAKYIKIFESKGWFSKADFQKLHEKLFNDWDLGLADNFSNESFQKVRDNRDKNQDLKLDDTGISERESFLGNLSEDMGQVDSYERDKPGANSEGEVQKTPGNPLLDGILKAKAKVESKKPGKGNPPSPVADENKNPPPLPPRGEPIPRPPTPPPLPSSSNNTTQGTSTSKGDLQAQLSGVKLKKAETRKSISPRSEFLAQIRQGKELDHVETRDTSGPRLEPQSPQGAFGNVLKLMAANGLLGSDDSPESDGEWDQD